MRIITHRLAPLKPVLPNHYYRLEIDMRQDPPHTKSVISLLEEKLKNISPLFCGGWNAMCCRVVRPNYCSSRGTASDDGENGHDHDPVSREREKKKE